jgi:hypothetical protein
MTSYPLASASGLTFGFYFFLALSAAVALMIYVLLTRPTVRRRELGLGTVRKPIAAAVGVLVGITVFSGIYLGSLAGFHTVTAAADHLRLDYAIPRRSVVLRYADVGDVMRRPAYKLQWRLELYTRTGSKFESAAGSYASIKEAAEDIERRRASIPNQ